MSISRLAPLVLAAAIISPVLGAAPIALTFPAPASNSIVKSNYFGLSIELSFYNLYFGNDTNSIPQPILNYFGAIRNHTGSLPVRMRLGGNSMDSSTYVSNQTDTMMYFTNPQANFNDQPVNFGPLLWDQMKAVSSKLGGAEYVVGLSLLSPDDSRAPNVPVMANDAKKALGQDLDVFLLGNEPDLYTGHFKRPQLKNYTVQNYFEDFKTASSGLGDISNPPLIGGPTVCCAWDLANLVQSGYLDQFKHELKYFSIQHYPQNWCSPPKHAFELPYYGQHSQTVTLANWNSPGLAMALNAGMTLMMSEFNSASCGGIPGISNTFLAGSLWTLDYALQLATVGFGAAYVHEREPGITYNIFEAPSGPAGSPGPWVTNPGMYALLIAPQVLGSGSDSRIIDLNVAGSMFDGAQSTAGYATYDVATGAISRLALLNFQNVTGSTNPVQTFTIPAEVFTNSTTQKLPNADPTKITVKFLTSTNVNEQYDISWAGKTYHNTGDGMMVDDNSGRPSVTTLDCSKGCSVDVPGPGMALVFVAPEAASANPTSDTKGGGSSSSSGSGSSQTASANGKNGASVLQHPVGLLGTLIATAFAFIVFA